MEEAIAQSGTTRWRDTSSGNAIRRRQVKVVRRLQAADPAQVRVQIARDLIRRVRELTRAINDLYE